MLARRPKPYSDSPACSIEGLLERPRAEPRARVFDFFRDVIFLGHSHAVAKYELSSRPKRSEVESLP